MGQYWRNCILSNVCHTCYMH